MTSVPKNPSVNTEDVAIISCTINIDTVVYIHRSTLHNDSTQSADVSFHVCLELVVLFVCVLYDSHQRYNLSVRNNLSSFTK